MFRNKTVFITGASRGIGKQIAIRLAKEGANVAIAAKTAEPHPKLPGTIYTAAAEIERAGGKALPLICDIRDEQQVESAINQCVSKFGYIDVLINNASAINLRPMAETSVKKFDLMHSVNSRGTWMVTKLCLPHLKKSAEAGREPKVLMMSPPLDMSKRWFEPHVGYSMAKYGMSMVVLGCSGEFQEDGIAVNALWPMTAIDTAAVSNVITDGGSDIMATTRKPDIMSEAAFVILAQPPSFTGQFCIDECILAQQGISNFAFYANDPRFKREELLKDFFVDEENVYGKNPSMVSRQVLAKSYVDMVNGYSKAVHARL